MTAHPAEPLSREDAAHAAWEEDMDVIRASFREELARAAAAGELTRARRTRITEDHLYALSAAGARLMEAMGRGPYPLKAHRGGGAA